MVFNASFDHSYDNNVPVSRAAKMTSEGEVRVTSGAKGRGTTDPCGGEHLKSEVWLFVVVVLLCFGEGQFQRVLVEVPCALEWPSAHMVSCDAADL